MVSSITRWDPWREMSEFRRTMDRMFGDGLSRLMELRPGYEDTGPYALECDVSEGPDRLVVKAAIPGIKPEDVEINVEDDVLTIRGQHQEEQASENESYLRRELHWGAFERSLRVPPTVDADRAEAHFEHGLLTVTLPKRPEAQPKKIKITAQPMIEGEKKD